MVGSLAPAGLSLGHTIINVPSTVWPNFLTGPGDAAGAGVGGLTYDHVYFLTGPGDSAVLGGLTYDHVFSLTGHGDSAGAGLGGLTYDHVYFLTGHGDAAGAGLGVLTCLQSMRGELQMRTINYSGTAC